jgi:hypothetical protein
MAFTKGHSGNPAGRPVGARHKATIAAEALLDGEAERLTRKAIETALGGDMTALRLCLDRIVPPRRERPVSFEMPPLSSAEDAMAAMAAITAAVCTGELSLGEAESAARLIEMFVRALEASDFDTRLRALEDARGQGGPRSALGVHREQSSKLEGFRRGG